METKELRGITYWERWAWHWVPAFLMVVVVALLLNLLPLRQLFGVWWALAIISWVSGGFGTLAGIVGRYVCFVQAEMTGPWIIVDTTIRPASLYRTAMYTPTNTGYAGPLCGPACVVPGQVYHSWSAAYQAAGALNEAHANLAAPAQLRHYDAAEWHGLVNAGWLAPGQQAYFGIVPYYEYE